MSNLLFEIGSEEIPAGYVAPALKHIEELFANEAKEARLNFKEIKCFGTPRKLTLFVTDLDDVQEEVEVEAAGPKKQAALDADGNYTKAALGFARGQGVDPSDLYFKETPKGECVHARKKVGGAQTKDLLVDILPNIITKISFPKSMRWMTNVKDTFARPLRSLLVLFSREVVDFTYNGTKTDRMTHGHPFLSPGKIEITEADIDEYITKLKEHKVIVRDNERKQIIIDELKKTLKEYGSENYNEKLVDEVNFMVEYPVLVVGSYPEDFLEVPEEILVASMVKHQRYFPVRGKDGKLVNKFITVSNRDGSTNELIREGNERVLKARLADARYFWDSDREAKLESRIDALKKMVFLKELGDESSFYLKAERMANISADFCKMSGGTNEQQEFCKRASMLAKADLTTEMVYEFPELQGVMGRYYAIHDGENKEVATAIDEHYSPRYSGAPMPNTLVGTCVAAAEKLDTIVSVFLIGKIPTGSQDPYGLRRSAMGLIRMATEGEHFHCDLKDAINSCVAQLLPSNEDKEKRHSLCDEVMNFFGERLSNMMINQGHRYDLVDAVLASGFSELRTFGERLRGVISISEEPWFNTLVTSVERAKNIIKDVQFDEVVVPQEDLLEAPEEKNLFDIYKQAEKEIGTMLNEKNFVEASKKYGELFSEPLNTFFDNVFVNVDDEKIKINRHKLLKAVSDLYIKSVADLSKVVEGKKP